MEAVPVKRDKAFEIPYFVGLAFWFFFLVLWVSEYSSSLITVSDVKPRYIAVSWKWIEADWPINWFILKIRGSARFVEERLLEAVATSWPSPIDSTSTAVCAELATFCERRATTVEVQGPLIPQEQWIAGKPMITRGCLIDQSLTICLVPVGRCTTITDLWESLGRILPQSGSLILRDGGVEARWWCAEMRPNHVVKPQYCHRVNGRHQSSSDHEQLGLDYAKSIGLSMRDPEFAGTLEIVCAFGGTLHSLMKIQTKTCIVVMR